MNHNAQAVDTSPGWRTLPGMRVRAIRYRAGAQQPRHQHDYSSFSLVLAGVVEETSSRETYRAEAGSLVIKPADCWHSDAYGAGGAHLVQVVPRDADAFWNDARWAYRWREAPQLARSMLNLVSGHSGSAESAELALWAAVESIFPYRSQRTGPAPGWWADAVDLLDECGERSISVGEVARRVGVHPVHLARVCRRQAGCTVRQYIRRRRVLLAWRACGRDEGSLAAIAARAGFADQAHMTRAFAEVLGISPARLRRLVARCDAPG